MHKDFDGEYDANRFPLKVMESLKKAQDYGAEIRCWSRSGSIQLGDMSCGEAEQFMNIVRLSRHHVNYQNACDIKVADIAVAVNVNRDDVVK